MPSAQRAIEIYSAIASELDAAFLAYWVAPNVVLTLSGARAFADGVFWDDQRQGLLATWQKEIQQSLAVLQKTVPLQWSEAIQIEARPGEVFAGFELLTREGLRQVLQNTKLFPGLSLEAIDSNVSAIDVQSLMIENLKQQQQQFATVGKEDLQHISFGALLGYPDQAIVGSIMPSGPEGARPEQEVAARISKADYYDCPQPVYSYPKSLVNDPDIQEHEQLWSSILADYYASDFHTQLEQSNAFKAKVREIGLQK